MRPITILTPQTWLSRFGTDTREVHERGMCAKVPHTGEGYLHADDDDSPYDVDGVMYCGRCHCAID